MVKLISETIKKSFVHSFFLVASTLLSPIDLYSYKFLLKPVSQCQYLVLARLPKPAQKMDLDATLFPAQALPHALIGVPAFHAYPCPASYPHSLAPPVYVQAS